MPEIDEYFFQMPLTPAIRKTHTSDGQVSGSVL